MKIICDMCVQELHDEHQIYVIRVTQLFNNIVKLLFAEPL